MSRDWYYEWRKLRTWVLEREKHYRALAQRNPGVFGRPRDEGIREGFTAVKEVMAAQVRQRKTRGRTR